MRGWNRNGLLASSAIVCMAAATPAAAQTKSFDVPAQSVQSAVNQLGRQADIQIIAARSVTRGARSNPVKGNMTVQQALATMLEGTGLTFRQTGPQTYTVVASPQSSDAQATDQTASSSGEDDSSADEEIVVTGTNIRGEPPVGSPLVVVSRADLESSGHGRFQDYIEQVPQNFTGISEDFSQSGTSNLARGTEIQLRGLGPGTTLTLINGRRQAPGGALSAFTDISSIPNSAIERVEILADGASAIYGSDAIGGVVNVILRKDLEGAESRLRLATSEGDANELQLSQLVGAQWSGGNLLLGYQYSRREALFNEERPYSAANGDMRRFGGSDLRRTIRGPTPGNIVNASGQVIAAIPAGQDGTDLAPADLRLGEVNYFDGRGGTLLPRQEIHSAFLSANHILSDRVAVELNARFAERRSKFSLASGATTTVPVPSTNPFYVNPLGGTAPVRVEYNFAADFGALTTDDGRSRSYAADLAAKIDLGRSWELRLSGAFAREDVLLTRSNLRNDAAIAAALADTNRATALNLFGDGSANNPETIAKIRQSRFDDGRTDYWSMNAIANGRLFGLAGGDARLALGLDAQWFDYKLNSNFEITGSTLSSRNIISAFGELVLPFLGEDSPAGRLTASVAGRFDRYDDAGSTFNPKFGLTWRPFDALDLRGTWGTAFRAPPFYLANQDLRPDRISISTLSSPAGPTTALVVGGTVPNLTEETAEVWTAGFDLRPTRGLTVSLTYFDIAYNDRIQVPGTPSSLLAFEAEFAVVGVVQRNPTAAQIAELCNRPGVTANCNVPIAVLVDNRIRNIASVKTNGVDLAVQYVMPTSVGQFVLGLSGTYMFKLEEAVTANSKPIDYIDTLGRPLDLRARGTLGWSLGPWRASSAITHAGAYAVPATGRRVSDSTIVDLSFGYSFEDTSGWANGLSLQLAANNLFNQQPPFVDQYSGYDTANGNVIGRTISLQLVKQW